MTTFLSFMAYACELVRMGFVHLGDLVGFIKLIHRQQLLPADALFKNFRITQG